MMAGQGSRRRRPPRDMLIVDRDRWIHVGPQNDTGEFVGNVRSKASPVEIELPNGGVVRLPLGVGQVVLLEVIRAVGALRPWKAPKS